MAQIKALLVKGNKGFLVGCAVLYCLLEHSGIQVAKLSHAVGGGTFPLESCACIHGSVVTVDVCNDKNTMYRNNLVKVAHSHKNKQNEDTTKNT